MPRGKLRVEWIKEKSPRQASFRKRRVTLFQKARELSVMCSVPAAVVVHGYDEEQPTVWPGVEEVKDILKRHQDLPDALKVRHRMDNEGVVRHGIQKMARKVDGCKADARTLEVNLILNDIALGRPREFADLPRELVDAVVSSVDALRTVTADRVKFLSSEGGAQAALPPPLLEEEEEAALLMALQEPPVVQTLDAMVAANAPVVLQAPAPPQSELVAAPAPLPQEEPPIVADAPLPPPLPEPQVVTAAGVEEPLNLDYEPRGGSFLLEMADAILDDGTGVGRLATAEDVDRLLREHGLEHFKFKPM